MATETIRLIWDGYKGGVGGWGEGGGGMEVGDENVLLTAFI